MPLSPVNLAHKLSQFSDYFNPRIIAELNGQQVKLVKFEGEFIWHKHDHEDELFMVLNGEFEMHFRDGIVTVRENEFLVVPRGVEHKPFARKEVAILLFEPSSTLNTGDRNHDFTRKQLESI